MGDDPQAAERRRRMGLPPMDPRNYDPRKAFDPAARERLARTQAVARAQAAAASTVVIATIVSLVTSAFGFVAAFAWNDAINGLLDGPIKNQLVALGMAPALVGLVKALIITLIAVLAVIILQRITARMVKKSAIDVIEAEQMM